MAPPAVTTWFDEFDSPIGMVMAVFCDAGLTRLAIAGQAHLPDVATFGEYRRGSGNVVADQLRAYLAGRTAVFDLPLAPTGTPFQREVWAALSAIPRGETATYGEIAAAIGRPGATRAVGSATGRNPLLIVVPCHRLVRSDGGLGGYAAGTALKAKLLTLEGAVASR